MSHASPAFLDPGRPDVPDVVVARGVVPFHLPHQPVRGRLVRLGPLADALLTRQDTPEPVTRLRGEALALVAALATALKFRGSFSLQAKGDGPVPMLLADCTESGALRGYARVDAERLAALLESDPDPSAAALLGKGYLAFTVDQGPDRERHQGLVAIAGGTLADMALHYFETSEQMACSLRVAAAPTVNGWRAGALILEKIAGAGGIDPERLLYRLFHEAGVATDFARALAYGCRCSRQRLSGILETFSADDLDHMSVDGEIVMTCEFCNHDFRFPRRNVRAAGG